MNTFDKFNKYWSEEKIDTPLVILIGGHIGTGKSTFASWSSQKINHSTVIPTGIVRAICKSMQPKGINQEVFKHTYNLGEGKTVQYSSDEEKALYLFKKQASIVQSGVVEIINFAYSEKQHYVLEGNHITPSFYFKMSKKYPVIGIFFKCENKKQYKETISGPTHFRKLTKKQLRITYCLHNYFVKEAKKYNIPIFDINQKKEAEDYLKTQLNNFMKNVEKTL